MIVEDEWGEDLEEIADSGDFDITTVHRVGVCSQIDFRANRQEYMNTELHRNLRNDLIEHLWGLKHGKGI